MTTEATDFIRLVDSKPAEREVQRFLEQRPHLLLNLMQARTAGVVKQFPLGADHRADFAFVHANSGGTYLHLVELESPRARIFTKSDSFSQQFNGALQQVQDWMFWSNLNAASLRELVKPILRHFGADTLYVQGTVIIGRRTELSTSRRRHRFEFLVQNLPRRFHVRTFDGLAEEIAKSAEPSSLVRLFSYRGKGFREVCQADRNATPPNALAPGGWRRR